MTVTNKSPDLVSSCEGSPQLLDSFGILDPADMEDFGNLTVSLEKIPSGTESNRHIHETFDHPCIKGKPTQYLSPGQNAGTNMLPHLFFRLKT